MTCYITWIQIRSKQNWSRDLRGPDWISDRTRSRRLFLLPSLPPLPPPTRIINELLSPLPTIPTSRRRCRPSLNRISNWLSARTLSALPEVASTAEASPRWRWHQVMVETSAQTIDSFPRRTFCKKTDRKLQKRIWYRKEEEAKVSGRETTMWYDQTPQ